jgi:hypothetical protein
MSSTKLLARSIRALLQRVGYDFVRRDAHAYSDFEAHDRRIIDEVALFTRTGAERVYALIQAIKYIAQAEVPGAIVECGVWRGGSMMAVARTLLELQRVDRDLFLFDTFTGMSAQTATDVDWAGVPATQQLAQQTREGAQSIWCYAPIEEVERVMYTTGYDRSRIHFVKGMVEQTIPGAAPETIALLRLDTDWYESTRHELIHLFPRLAPGGVLILDDYGHWQGARQAWDEYSAEHRVTMFLNRVDYSARIGVKP